MMDTGPLPIYIYNLGMNVEEGIDANVSAPVLVIVILIIKTSESEIVKAQTLKVDILISDDQQLALHLRG